MKEDELPEDKLLSVGGHTEPRTLAARAHYLAQDLVELQLAAREVCRFTSSPAETSGAALEWLGK